MVDAEINKKRSAGSGATLDPSALASSLELRTMPSFVLSQPPPQIPPSSSTKKDPKRSKMAMAVDKSIG